VTLNETEEFARAIINTCASPGACDVVRIERATSSVTIHLLDEQVELDFTQNDFFAQVSLLKRLIALLTSHVRANAMLDATGDAAPPPLWLLSSSQFFAEWVCWAGADDGLRTYSSWAHDFTIWPQMPTQVEIATTHSNRDMALSATLYAGELTGVLILSTNPLCRFSWSRRPEIKIDATALPETVIASLLQFESEGANGTLRLSEIVSHPFFDVYDPVVVDIANDGGALVIRIEDRATTLRPVPSSALQILPSDCDQALPWEPTRSELERLRNLNPMAFQSRSDG